ncbi:MAG TPA: ribosome maturation factor RimM [Steroidobacteraceae bacterium]|nr:ribosome maturation factor RimM [Steroidobacteraceae bacterium]
MSEPAPALIELGVVGAPFGVRGWVKVRSFTEPAESLLEHGALKLWVAGEWRTYELEAAGRSGGQLTVKLQGVEDRNAAEVLRGASIGIERERLPRTAPREYYRADLLGCEVLSVAGTRLGTLEYFIETPAHACMVVRGAREYWVPAVPQYLRSVDLTARRVVVDWDETS